LDLGPGSYQPDKKFGEGIKTYSIVGGRKEPADKKIPGPGSYQPERSQSQTKYRTPNTIIAPDNGQKVQDPADGQVGPGAYSAGKNFGDDVKSFEIRGKAPEQKPNGVPGVGHYSPESSPTRFRNPAVKIRPPSRTLSQNNMKPDDANNIGPGSYNDGKDFGTGAKTFKIHDKPAERQPVHGVGPGEYSLDDKATKHRNPSAFINKDSNKPERPSSQNNTSIGPGAYDAGKSFGDDVKTFKIGEKSKERPADPSRGPGEYNLNDSPTRHRNPTIQFSKKP